MFEVFVDSYDQEDSMLRREELSNWSTLEMPWEYLIESSSSLIADDIKIPDIPSLHSPFDHLSSPLHFPTTLPTSPLSVFNMPPTISLHLSKDSISPKTINDDRYYRFELSSTLSEIDRFLLESKQYLIKSVKSFHDVNTTRIFKQQKGTPGIIFLEGCSGRIVLAVKKKTKLINIQRTLEKLGVTLQVLNGLKERKKTPAKIRRRLNS